MRILYLDLDTLRPDHLGCYGYSRDTSPNIDRIAKEGVRFTNYYCTDAPCLPSRAALITGQFGIHTGAVGHGGTAADIRLEGKTRGFGSRLARESLPGYLRSHGFNTVSISPFAERHGAWWFYAGFNEIHNTGQGGMESAEHVSPTALEWIQNHGSQDDWFLHINYWDPHTPYRAPAEFGNPFADDPLPAWLTQDVLEEHRKLIGPHKSREINMFNNATDPRYPRHPGELHTMDDVRRMIDGYDCGIRYMDEHIGALFAALEAQGVMDELVVIISSDHGENIGELGIYGEHGTADNITCRIPMIIRWPNGQQNHKDDGLHYNLDLAPTLAELIAQDPAPRWDGQSYAAAVTEGTECGREALILSQCAHVCQRSVRFGPWIYMKTYHDGYHLFPDEMLYHVEDDPHEQTNLATQRPDICAQAAAILQQWHEQMMREMPDGYTVDPLWTVMQEGGPFHAKGHLKDYCSFLEQTDRAYGIPELKQRHPGEFEV